MNEAIKKGWPHVVVVILFFALAAIYFAPELFDGKGLVQGDVKQRSGLGKRHRGSLSENRRARLLVGAHVRRHAA